MRSLLVGAAAAALVLGAAPAAPARTDEVSPRAPAQPAFPIRIAAYYPWFPEGWTYTNMLPFTHFHPTLGWYDAGDSATIARHIRSMLYGRIEAATYSWWGQGSPTDLRLARHLRLAAATPFRFAVYYEAEGYGNPSVEEIRDDLAYIGENYGSRPGYLRIDGRFVVFVYGEKGDGDACAVIRRWRAANTVGAYLVLRGFSGFRLCAEQPDGWHAYSAHKFAFDLRPYAYSISPGFYFAPDDAPRRRRNLARWKRDVRRMSASGAHFQYVISFNEWGEGTAVESAEQWRSRSGHGSYLDALRAVP